MTPPIDSSSDHDLLIALSADLKAFYDEFRRVSNGVGFPRCAERRGEIEAARKEAADAHRRIDTLNARLWWAITFSITSGLGFITTVILSLVKGAMN